jgi:hypothetical protein
MTQTMWGGEAVTTETQIDRDERHAAMLRIADDPPVFANRLVPAEEIVPVDPGTKYITEQAEPPIKVGTIRGLIAGVAGALITGLLASVSVLASGGDDRAAILAGAAGALTGLGTIVSAFAGFGYADQASRAREVSIPPSAASTAARGDS